MKHILVVFILIVTLGVGACSGDNAKGMFETAQFEEIQNNKEHARELYEEIVRTYPKSEYAAKAKERLDALKGGR
jgi:TolA-binding protein